MFCAALSYILLENIGLGIQRQRIRPKICSGFEIEG